MAYLTPQQAHDRLSTYEFDSLPSVGALELASRKLDTQGPFRGARYTMPQPLAFPRSFTVEGDTEGEVPDAILDWVAIEAHKLTGASSGGSGGDKPPVSSVSHSGAGSVTYARPKVSLENQIQAALLSPYLRQTGTMT